MDQDNRTSGNGAIVHIARSRQGGSRPMPLRLVSSQVEIPLSLPSLGEAWRSGASDLLAWLGVEGDLARIDPTTPFHSPASVFDKAPSACWVASYLREQGSGLMLPRGGIDVVLISPHPAASGDWAVREEIIRAAQSEGRERIALIETDRPVPANRAATILSVGEAMHQLAADAIPWDAIIAPPDLRASLFGELARIAHVRGPWPSLLHEGRAVRISAEAGGGDDIPLDVHCLVQSLALALWQSGRVVAARRLYDAWARLRDTGITTPARGSAGPYASVLADRDCIAMICKGLALSRRDVPGWKALSSPMRPLRGSQTPALRVVAKGAVFP